MTATTEDILSEDVALAETAPTNGAVVEGTATDASLTELTETSTSDASVIKIVKGSPTDVEIAALVSVLAAAAGSGQAPESNVPAETGAIRLSSTARVRRSRRTRT